MCPFVSACFTVYYSQAHNRHVEIFTSAGDKPIFIEIATERGKRDAENPAEDR